MLRRWVIGGLIAVATLLLAGRFLAVAYVDYLWYDALGAGALWKAEVRYRLLLGVGSAVVATLFLFANLYSVRRSVVSLILPKKLGNLEIGEEVPGRYLTQLALGVSAIGGVLLAISRERWVELAAVLHSVPFNERDPYFTRDISYFVNWLPFEKTLFGWSVLLLVTAFIAVTILYALTPSLRWERGRGLRVTLYVRRHFGVIAGLALLIVAWSFRLDNFDALFQGSGVDGAFISTDKVMHEARPVMTFITMLAAFLLVWAMWTDQLKFALVCIGTILLMSIGFKQVVPVLIRPQDADGGAARERPFLATRAGFTRRAFGVDEILPAAPLGTFAFPTWTEAVAGTPAWDTPQLQKAITRETPGALIVGSTAQLSSNAGQVMQSIVRTGPETDAAWSAIRTLSTRTKPDGSPLGSLPVTEDAALIPPLLTEPPPASHVVADSLSMLYAPALESGLSRLAHAWSSQDFHVLFRDLPQPNPRILMHAGVRERLTRLAPFFDQGEEIYPVLHGDTLFWVVHLYSYSGHYPLAHAVEINGRSVRYYRHAATAVLNSATGRTQIFVAAADPLTRMWQESVPALFAPRQNMPGAIAAELPPPVEEVIARGTSFARYGMRQDTVYGGYIPRDSSNEGENGVSMTLIHLPGLGPVSAWVIPQVNANDRLDGLLISTGGDSPHTYLLDVEPWRVSWRETLRAFAAAHDSVSKASGTAIVSGPVRAVPIAGAIALVQTHYSDSPGSKPQIAAVSVLENDVVRTGTGLHQAAGLRGSTDPRDSMDPREFYARVSALYEAMRAALGRRDLTAFGELFNSLGILLGEIPR